MYIVCVCICVQYDTYHVQPSLIMSLPIEGQIFPSHEISCNKNTTFHVVPDISFIATHLITHPDKTIATIYSSSDGTNSPVVAIETVGHWTIFNV